VMKVRRQLAAGENSHRLLVVRLFRALAIQEIVVEILWAKDGSSKSFPRSIFSRIEFTSFIIIIWAFLVFGTEEDSRS
jgi:hypothetical protein